MKNNASISLLILFVALCSPLLLQAQVSINKNNDDPDPSAILDVKSTEKGVLMPRMTAAERDAIANPVAGLMIFNVEDSCFNYYSGTDWIKDCGIRGAAGQLPVNSFAGDGQDQGEGVSYDAAGNTYVAGSFRGTLSIGNEEFISVGQADIYVAKISTNGEVLWAMQLGSTDGDAANDITTDAAGNSFVAGFFTGTVNFGSSTLTSKTNSNGDAFVMKVDPQGQIVWAKRTGGNNYDLVSGVSLDPNGNSYITGIFNGTADFDGINVSSGGGEDLFVAKLNSNGQFVWATRAGGIYPIYATDIATDAMGNSYLTGQFVIGTTIGTTSLSSSGTFDSFVAKITTDGTFTWAKRMGGNNADEGTGIATDAAGNSYLTGYFRGTADFGGTNLTSAGANDIYVVKINTLGQTLWASKAGANGDDFSSKIAIDEDGNSYLNGRFTNNATFGSTTLTSGGSFDLFVSKLDPNGQFLWTKQVGGTGDAQSRHICIDAANRVHATGFFNGQADFDGQSLTSSGADDAFLWTLDAADGSQTEFDSDLADLQDGDKNSSNELQNLQVVGNELIITKGNKVALSQLAQNDNLGDHTATQNLELGGNWLSNDGGNEGVFVAPNGNVGIGTNSPNFPLEMNSGARVSSGGVWTNASDSTRKYAIQDLGYGLEEVMQLRPTAYYYKADSSASIGFIAQEVKPLIPEAVSGEEGNMGVAYGLMSAVVVKAMQEQQQIIEQQQKLIEKLQEEKGQQQAEIGQVKAQLEAQQASFEARLQTLEAIFSNTK